MQDAMDRIVAPLLGRLDAAIPAGYSAVLYGSAARGEHRPGLSDLNLLVVCESLAPSALRHISGAMTGLRRRRQAPPLLIEREEWERSSDVFPIEISDMQIAHTVLRGTDPVAGLTVDPADLRRALEAELRARLLRLRQTYAAGFDNPKLLGQAAGSTVSSIATLFRMSLVLADRPVPLQTPASLTAAGNALGVDPRPVIDVWEHRGTRRCTPDLFEGYLSTVRAAVRAADQFTRGGL